MEKAFLFTLVVLFAVSTGCGGETSKNGDTAQVETAEGEASPESAVLKALDAELGLGEVGGVDDTFSPAGEGCEAALAETSGPGCCVIETIFIGDDIGFFLNRDMVVAPDQSFAVQVGKFSGTDRSVCLKTAKEAIRSIGSVSLP